MTRLSGLCRASKKFLQGYHKDYMARCRAVIVRVFAEA